jgi:hypothetical protein
MKKPQSSGVNPYAKKKRPYLLKFATTGVECRVVFPNLRYAGVRVFQTCEKTSKTADFKRKVTTEA